MKTIRSSLLAMALLTPLAASAADELVDATSASMGAGLDVDFGSTASLGRALDVAGTPTAGLSAPMEVDGRGLDAAGPRTLSPFDGQLADALPPPVPPMAPIDLFADQVRGMGIEAVDWLAPRVRYPSTLPEEVEGGAGQAVARQFLDMVAPPFGLQLEPLLADGQLSLVDADPVFGLPRYARAWKLGPKGRLYVAVSAIDGLREIYARAALEVEAAGTPAALDRVQLAGRSALLAQGEGLAVAVAPIDEVYAVVAVVDGAAAYDAPFVTALLRGLNRTPGLDRDAAIADALVPGASVHFAFDTGPLDGTLATALAWSPVAWSLSESALSATVQSMYGIDVTLAPLTGVPTPMAAPLSPAGTSWAVLGPDPQGQPGVVLGQLNVSTTSDRPERVAAFIARALKSPPAVTLVDGRYLLTGTYVDASNQRRPEYAYRATLTPLADGTTFVTQSHFVPGAYQAAQLHAHPALDLALPGLAGQTAAPAAGPTLPAMNLAVRRATRREESVTLAGSALRPEPSGEADPGVGAVGLGYGTGGLVLTYEPLTTQPYLLIGAQFGSIVNPEGNDEEGGVDFFAHGRYQLPMQFLPNLTTEVSAGVHFGVAGSSALGIGVRAAAHYRIIGSLTGWLAIQSQHYPNAEVNGSWLALSLGVGYRPE